MATGAPSDVLARQHAARGGATTREGYIAGAGGEVLQTRIAVPPPELVQYPEAAALFLGGSQSIATGTVATVAQLGLAQGDVAVIRSIVLSGVNTTTALIARWRLVVNGGTVEGFDRAMPPQNSASAVEGWGPDEVLVRVSAGGVITLEIEVIAGGPITLGMQAGGWRYPFTLRDRYRDVWNG